MELFLTALLLLLAASVTYADWRRGLYFIPIAGFAQDVLRKLSPEQSLYYTVLVVAVMLMVVLRMLLDRYPFWPDQVVGWRGRLTTPLAAFVIVVFLQTLHTLAGTGSLFLPVLGLLTYLLPVAALMLGYFFARDRGEHGIEGFLALYCAVAVAALSGIYLEYAGVSWPVLGEVGEGLTIYDLGTILQAYSGFLRSSEIAAWHVVTATSLMFLLLIRTRSMPARYFYLAGIVVLIALGVLTGRRKLVANLVLFAGLYAFLLFYFQLQATRLAFAALTVGFGLFAATNLLFSQGGETDEKYALYLERAETVFGDAPERAQKLGIGATVSAVKRFGLFGLGAGTAGTAARFAKGAPQGNLWEGEGGIGRVVIELGLIGLLVSGWLAVALVMHMWRILRYLSLKKPAYSTLYYGLFALLLTNFAHFFVASAVFSDPFILLMLGLIFGFINTAPVLVMREESLRRSLRRVLWRRYGAARQLGGGREEA